MDLCFNKDLLRVLLPDEIIGIELILSGHEPVESFFSSAAYEKLFEVFAEEMPYEVAKCREDTPDRWILSRLMEVKNGDRELNCNGFIELYF
jgi:hypothetical protein